MADRAANAAQRLQWQSARIEAVEALSPRVRRIVLRPQHWHRPQAGQHLDVRLTAPDGYQAQRSYSLLSPPDRVGVYELGIELLPEGEVSPWFHEAAQVGESIEVLGPVGGHFVWPTDATRPTLLVGGGSGVVPLLSMAADYASGHQQAPLVLVVAARTLDEVLLWPQLQQWESQGGGFSTFLALSRSATRSRPQDRLGRLQTADLAAAVQRLGAGAAQSASVYVCGRNAFVDSVVEMLRTLHIPDTAIRTERFGG